MTTLKRRMDKLEQARIGKRGKLVMRYDHYGDSAALQAHQAAVKAKEAEGFKVISIVVKHVQEGMGV